MKVTGGTCLLVQLLLCARFALAALPLPKLQDTPALPTVPNKFIIEVDSTSDIPDKRSAPSRHERVYQSLNKRGVGFTVNKEFDSDLFTGAVLTLSDKEGVAELQQTRGIKAIRPVIAYSRPEPVEKKIVSVDSPVDKQATHVITGVDKLHAEGVTGAGVTIGIIDTGIDYTHPALGGGFGPGFKVSGGYDFVGDAYNGGNDPIPDYDPLDQCEGHGTHVAGILGADPGNAFNISGVAYSASINAYRIFGCSGGVADDIILEALIRAYEDDVDVLTMSFGASAGWTEGTSSVVASRIAASGKIVTIAAGNWGSAGSWFTAAPSNGIDVISVASLDNTAIPLQNVTVSGAEHDPITYWATWPWPYTQPLPIYVISNSTTVAADACSALPDETPDLSKYIVIVRRGGCNFSTKLAYIAAKGGVVAFIYDNGLGFSNISSGGQVKTSLIQAADGEWLVSQWIAGIPITITFPQSGASTDYPNPDGGLISAYSSYGPSHDFYFKPAITTPGGSILSLWPVPLGGYAIASGTSMSAPFAAGSAALLFSVKGKSAAVGKSARTLFETTAKKVPSTHDEGAPYQTLTQQGAGLINVYDAIRGTTIVSPGELILNDTTHFNGVQTFSVENTGSSVKTYTLSNVPAGTALTIKPGSIFPASGPVPLSTAAASVQFSQTTFTLDPGQSKTITATFTPPSGVDATTLPVYSGWIDITSGSEITQVAYMGLAASLKDKQVLDDTDSYLGIKLPVIFNSGGVQTNATNYTFVGDDTLTLLLRIAFGTADLRVDLVSGDTTLPTLINGLDTRGTGDNSSFTFPVSRKKGSFNKISIVGTLAEYTYVPRNDDIGVKGSYTLAMSKAQFADGTTIPKGSYKILVRALRVTGDLTKDEDYDSWLSPGVGVV